MSAQEPRSPFLPAFLAWLVPGAGHLAIGRLWPGVFVFTAILPLYVGGMAMTGFENVSWERHPIYFWAVHVFGGALTGAAALLTRDVSPIEYMPEQKPGELFTAVACLLNLIAVADVWSRCVQGDPEARAASAESAADSAAAPPPDASPPASPSTEASGG